MDIDISPLATHPRASGKRVHAIPPVLGTSYRQTAVAALRHQLSMALAGHCFVQWIELPIHLPLDGHAVAAACQRLRRYLHWMLKRPIVTILHSTTAQVESILSLPDTYLACDWSTHPATLQSGPIDIERAVMWLGADSLRQQQGAWSAAPLTNPVALEVHGLTADEVTNLLAIVNPTREPGKSILLSDVPPDQEGCLWLFDSRNNSQSLRAMAGMGKLPQGLVHRWQCSAGSPGHPVLPEPTNFEKSLQLCSHLAQILKEPTRA
ncbi:hypothetical protein [Pseudomonas sp. Irchel s3a18]|uniref:hypothetical protein n=1 Tax=Pseudomonas sp. Irchel s3a18 TaxID=2009053 RepID=UPI00117A71AF|nr:hypothetical protein [Pseudomonas sp. Irchel s3a18]